MRLLRNTTQTEHFMVGGMRILYNKNYQSYVANGHKGVEISLSNGKKKFIGTPQPESLIERLNIKYVYALQPIDQNDRQTNGRRRTPKL